MSKKEKQRKETQRERERGGEGDERQAVALITHRNNMPQKTFSFHLIQAPSHFKRFSTRQLLSTILCVPDCVRQQQTEHLKIERQKSYTNTTLNSPNTSTNEAAYLTCRWFVFPFRFSFRVKYIRFIIVYVCYQWSYVVFQFNFCLHSKELLLNA